MKLRPVLSFVHIKRPYYVSTNENSAVLIPFMEFSKVLSDETLAANIASRNMNLDLPSLISRYEIYRKMDLDRCELMLKREQNVNKLKEIQTLNLNSTTKEVIAEGKRLRSEMKILKEQLNPIRDDFVNEFLKLPNKLHDKTPLTDITLLYRQGLPTTDDKLEKKANHLDRSDLIDYRSPTCYYLKKEAAIFDINAPINCVQRFLENNYTQFINPDFARTVLLEASATDINGIEQITEDARESKVNLLHLTGGGSLISFLGFIAKLSIFRSHLPLRFVSSGREYLLPSHNIESKGLYTVAQSNVVQAFIAAENELDLDKEIENALSLVIDMFQELQSHFRIVYLPAYQLSATESLRVSIQMFSPFYGTYIDVGHLSNYASYLSKRLLFNFKEKQDCKFPYIAAGPIINVTKVVACLLDNNRNLNNLSLEKKDAIKSFNNLFV